MATLYDRQEERDAEGRFAEWFDRVLTCRESARNMLDAPEAWQQHVRECPLGDQCEAFS